ncbi:DUF6114 domain-containing protein [Brevibacterium atlanticum]|uniref:DUF6114 domain-containing protein n=1 Tax=Brevibacterium atlanticum TaxID=2697563 RepID=UPI001AA19758|nr:DUF6114 domain-containing protein [Brevibacterium atlanticum]
MKESAANGHPTDERGADDQEATVQKTSLLALSRRSRRAEERRADEQSSHPESDVETAEFAAATSDAGNADTSEEAEMSEGAAKRGGFKHWRRQRPFIGGVLAVIGGIELFFSGQLDLGNIQIQFGIEGLQATVLPIVIVVLALLTIFKPTHHVFYGIIALVLAVYSLIGVNLGGFIIGMLLSTIGAILMIAWMGPREEGSG